MTALVVCLAAVAGDWFTQGNSAYEAGQYTQAVAFYDSAAATGDCPEVYFNRGNAKFKQGMIGAAIADYLRAWVLSPHDRDIRHNLEFARRFRPDRIAAMENPLIGAATQLIRLIPLRLARLLAGVLFLAALAALAFFLVNGRKPLAWLAAGLGVLFLYCLAGQLSWRAVTSSGRVVVVVPELVLRAGPGAEYKEIVIVHDGMEATVRERRPEWVLIQVPGGEGGWAEFGTVEQVFVGQRR